MCPQEHFDVTRIMSNLSLTQHALQRYHQRVGNIKNFDKFKKLCARTIANNFKSGIKVVNGSMEFYLRDDLKFYAKISDDLSWTVVTFVREKVA